MEIAPRQRFCTPCSQIPFSVVPRSLRLKAPALNESLSEGGIRRHPKRPSRLCARYRAILHEIGRILAPKLLQRIGGWPSQGRRGRLFGVEPARHLFPNVRIGGHLSQVGVLQGETRGLELIIVTAGAVLLEDRFRNGANGLLPAIRTARNEKC